MAIDHISMYRAFIPLIIMVVIVESYRINHKDLNQLFVTNLSEITNSIHDNVDIMLDLDGRKHSNDDDHHRSMINNRTNQHSKINSIDTNNTSNNSTIENLESHSFDHGSKCRCVCQSADDHYESYELLLKELFEKNIEILKNITTNLSSNRLKLIFESFSNNESIEISIKTTTTTTTATPPSTQLITTLRPYSKPSASSTPSPIKNRAILVPSNANLRPIYHRPTTTTTTTRRPDSISPPILQPIIPTSASTIVHHRPKWQRRAFKYGLPFIATALLSKIFGRTIEDFIQRRSLLNREPKRFDYVHRYRRQFPHYNRPIDNPLLQWPGFIDVGPIVFNADDILWSLPPRSPVKFESPPSTIRKTFDCPQRFDPTSINDSTG